MPRVPEHYGEQEGEGGDSEYRGVNLPVGVHTVGVHQVLVASGELVSPTKKMTLDGDIKYF